MYCSILLLCVAFVLCWGDIFSSNSGIPTSARTSLRDTRRLMSHHVLKPAQQSPSSPSFLVQKKQKSRTYQITPGTTHQRDKKALDLITESQKLFSSWQALFDHHGVATVSFNAFNHAFLSETRALENATSIKSVWKLYFGFRPSPQQIPTCFKTKPVRMLFPFFHVEGIFYNVRNGFEWYHLLSDIRHLFHDCMQ